MNVASNIINALIQKEPDPIRRSSFIAIAEELKRLGTIVDPKPVVQKKVSAKLTALPLPIVTFTATTNRTNVILEWTAPSDNILLYEIRVGSTWSTATRILTTGNLKVILDPIATGSTTYLIKSLDSYGNYSEDSKSVTITIPIISPVVITSSVIANNVLLYWSEPTTTFNIAYYEVYRASTLLGRITGTFKALIELVGGTFIYKIIPYDIYGNAGTPATTSAILVSNPPDFTLKASFTSGLTGTKTNAVVEGNSLLVCVNLTETYENHFSTRSWASPQAQVDAGFPLYIQPALLTASYLEIFDIGVIYTNTIIGLSSVTSVVTGSFTMGFSTRVSDDNISWSAAQTGPNIYVASARYIEVTLTFTGSATTALLNFYNFQVSVNVKQEMDSGEIAALSTDANGTVVTFAKAFKDVDSITVSVKTTTEQYTAVYRFNDVPNPTTFSVFVYDSSGIRVSKTVEWKARGIV